MGKGGAVEGRAAVLWDEEPTRSARVAEILAVQGERLATWPLIIASLSAVALPIGWRCYQLLSAGRLRRPLVEVPPQQVSDWLASHPTGRALLVLRRAEEVPAGLHTEDLRRHRGGRLAIVSRDPDRE